MSLLPRPKLCFGERHCFTCVSLSVCLFVLLWLRWLKKKIDRFQLNLARHLVITKRRSSSNLTRIAVIECKPCPKEILMKSADIIVLTSEGLNNWIKSTDITEITTYGLKHPDNIRVNMCLCVCLYVGVSLSLCKLLWKRVVKIGMCSTYL